MKTRSDIDTNANAKGKSSSIASSFSPSSLPKTKFIVDSFIPLGSNAQFNTPMMTALMFSLSLETAATDFIWLKP